MGKVNVPSHFVLEMNPKLKGQDRRNKESALKSARNNSFRSIPVVTCYIHSCIEGILEDESYGKMEEIIEGACCDPSLLDVDHRVQQQFALMLFCCKKVDCFQ